MSDLIVSIVILAITLGAAFGLSYWAFRARHDRSAYVGLYLVFGLPGLLLALFGLAFALNGREGALVLLAVGLGLALPLLRPVRRLFAAVTPIDAASPVDMTGLCLLLALIGFFVVSLGLNPDPPDDASAVGVDGLIVQVIAEVALAYAAVGWWFYRNAAAATDRLGLWWPSVRGWLVALGCVVLGFLVNGVAGLLTQWLQPDFYADIERVTEEITSGVQNPGGALLLGLSAGIGEELLLRGALQPRFGIVLTSIFFALLHTQYGFSLVMVGLFATGVLLGLERKYFGTVAAIATHAIFNALVVLGQAAN